MDTSGGQEPLIAELSYIIARLHKDMYLFPRYEVPLVHGVVVSVHDRSDTSSQQLVCLFFCFKKK
jgi:hypothetical protein